MRAMSAKRYAYVACTVNKGWGVALCIEGRAGYKPLIDYRGPYPVERAEGIADRLNRRAGLSPSDVAVIAVSSMKPLSK
jgi:hypothetical protein